MTPGDRRIQYYMARPIAGGKFLSPKGTRYYEVQYNNDCRKFLKSYELNRIFIEYQTDSTARDVGAQEEMWEAAISLHRAIVSNSVARSPRHRQNRFTHDLYEAFYKIESKRCISRPNFFTCMRQLFKEMSTDNPLRSIGMGLEALYDKFDMLGTGALNWRRFLLYLHVASNPTLHCREQLLHAFSFIASQDGINFSTSAKASIDIHDISTVIFPLVRAECIPKAVSVMDEAWSNVRSSGRRDGSKLTSTKITLDVFELMLNDESMKSLLGQSASKWGRFASFPVYISQWEEDFYNDRLLQLVRDGRIAFSIRSKLQRDDNWIVRAVWKEWKSYTMYQQSLRSILNSIDTRKMNRMKYRGLLAFIDWSRRTLVALTLQRVGRGYFGRRVAYSRWRIKRSAITMQCFVRMYFAKQRLIELASKYLWAVVTIQRIFRGMLARRVAFKRLMSRVERERIQNTEEKKRLLLLRGIWSITRIQSCFRRFKAKSHANELRAARQSESDIRHAMEARIEKFRKERKVYERQLEEYYRSKKEEYMRNINIQSKITNDQISVRTLRRRLKNEELKNASPDETELIQDQQWKHDWEVKIETGVDSIKQHCAHCLKCPDNRAEKKIGLSVRKRVKARVKVVLKRADSRGIQMETKEATSIATEEMLHIIGEEERARLTLEMQNALDQRAKDKEEARLQAEAKKDQESARATVFAASVVARAYRNWIARRELRLRCTGQYEKDYDEESNTFFYRNKLTGETFWTKPKAMGSFEMPTKDEWKVLRDAHNFPYYYNPCSMNMQWNPPIDQVMCCGQVPHHWYLEFPVRRGQCPYFAVQEVYGSSYCQKCLDASLQRIR